MSSFVLCTWSAEGSLTPALQSKHTPESLPEQDPGYLKYYELVAGSGLLPKVLENSCWQKAFDDLNFLSILLLVTFDPLYVVG